MKFLGLTTLAVAAHGAPNIVELAQSVESLSTLVTAVVAGDLVGTLSSPGPFTVFAPINDAFKALPFDSLTGLLKPENKAVLVDVLTNHVVGGQITSKDFDNYGIHYATTVAGHKLSLSGGRNKRVCAVSTSGLGCRYFESTDTLASNGVVHIINGVLVPDEDAGHPALPNRLVSSNIVELAQSVKDLSTLVAAVVAGDLAGTLSSPGAFTVFAPTNEGFAKLPAGTVDSLLKPENKAQLVDILTYHVLPTQVDSREFGFTKEGFFTIGSTVEGKPLRLFKSGGKPMVGPNVNELKMVTAADNFATNGIVHVVDGVLLPSSVANDQTIRLTRCKGKAKGTFDAKDGVCYQLSEVPESSQRIDQRVLCQPNGDSYILKYFSNDGSCSNENAPFGIRTYVKKGACYGGLTIDCNPSTTPNIVELAESVGDLSTLVSAVVAGDLANTLSSPGPFTVFAPTNEAFTALPDGVLDTLMKPANKAQLVDVLTYHVLPAKVLSTDLELFQEVKTVEGKKLKVQKFGGKVQVGASLESKDLKQVTSADNTASNGVVHIINGVLLPPSEVQV